MAEKIGGSHCVGKEIGIWVLIVQNELAFESVENGFNPLLIDIHFEAV